LLSEHEEVEFVPSHFVSLHPEGIDADVMLWEFVRFLRLSPSRIHPPVWEPSQTRRWCWGWWRDTRAKGGAGFLGGDAFREYGSNVIEFG
jgi:hypothetical protein